MRCCRWSPHPLPDHKYRSHLHQSDEARNTLSFGNGDKKRLFVIVGDVMRAECRAVASCAHLASRLLAERRGEGSAVYIRQLYVARTDGCTGSRHRQCHRGGGSHFGSDHSLALAMRSRTGGRRVPHTRRTRCGGTFRSKAGSHDLFQRVRWPSPIPSHSSEMFQHPNWCA
jgi:hypothetical protein